MDKEAVVHRYNGILLSHKKEHIWVSCSDVDKPRACYTEWRSQKEKEIWCINAYKWDLENSTDEPIYREEMETEKMVLWTQWGKERVGQAERAALTHMHHCV